MKRKYGLYALAIFAALSIGWVSGWHEHFIPTVTDTYDVGSTERIVRIIHSGKVFSGGYNYADSITYTGDLTITVVMDHYPTLETGLVVAFRATTPNTTGAVDLVYNSTTDAIKMLNNQTPAASYIESGSMVEVTFDGTNWQLQTPDANP